MISLQGLLWFCPPIYFCPFTCFFYSLFLWPKEKAWKLVSMFSSLLPKLLPYGPICLHPTSWSSLTTLHTLLEWLVKTLNLRKENDKCWPTHPVSRSMSLNVRKLWVMGLTKCVCSFYPFFSMISSIHSPLSHSLIYVLSNWS